MVHKNKTQEHIICQYMEAYKRVCKKFFIQTLDISDKMIRCTLSRKTHGTFEGTDKRGKHTPDNKTSDDMLANRIQYQVLSYNG